MRDMRAHDVDMLTVGQYLAAARGQSAGAPLRASGDLPQFGREAARDGLHARGGAAPLVRSSYHADQQALRGRRLVTSSTPDQHSSKENSYMGPAAQAALQVALFPGHLAIVIGVLLGHFYPRDRRRR